MRGSRDNWWYLIATVALVAGLATWFSLPSFDSASPRSASAQTDSAQTSPDDSSGSTIETVGLIALLVIPLAAIIVIARLQHRRKAAFRDAARIQREQARAAELNRNQDLR
jgi:hypothetical protein